MLKGCCCDPENPIRLQDGFILNAIEHSIKAREDLNLLFPALFPCEQERLELLFARNPLASTLEVDPTEYADAFQKALNRIPVYTAGPQMGKYRGKPAASLPPSAQAWVPPKRCR